MTMLEIRDFSFKYSGANELTINSANMSINEGDFAVLIGKSGSGKSSLLRNICASIAPHGEKSGEILLSGTPISDLTKREASTLIGFVQQNADNQIVTDKVWHELVFGLESLGLSNLEIRLRAAEIATFFGIQTWFHKNVSELSGGQKQILMLASIMIMQPKLLILDEPTAQLDPIATTEFIETLKRINRELGTTILITEHRLEEVFQYANSVFFIEDGKIVFSGTPQNVVGHVVDSNSSMFYSMPTTAQIYVAVDENKDFPLNVEQARRWIANKKVVSDIEDNFIENKNDYVIETKDVWFRYEKEHENVLKGMSFAVREGEFYCMLGGNGVGKSTALRLLSGLKKPNRGTIKIKGKKINEYTGNELYNGIIGVVPQNPQSLFSKKTAREELKEMSAQYLEIAELMDLKECLERHPYDLSVGEQQRLAIAKVLLCNPSILLFDEPTKGMDNFFKIQFAEIIRNLKERGITVLMISHDIEFCAQYADRCGLMFDGQVITENNARDFFSGNSFYTTVSNKLARDKIDKAITVKDVVEALGGKVKEFAEKKQFPKTPLKGESDEPKKEKPLGKDTNKISLKVIISWLVVLALIPVTFWIGENYIGVRKYYFESMILIVLAIVPFVVSFEAAKPSAREVVLLATLTGIAVIGRLAFYMTPSFKPVVAICIVSGVCLGGRAGFIVGILSAFVSNFFFGQGPYTPWQMFALGAVGLLAGIMLKNKLFKGSRWMLGVWGFIATVVIYGGIMNFSNMVFVFGDISIEKYLASVATGVAFDVLHGFSTFVFLLVGANSMIEKIERIKNKYLI